MFETIDEIVEDIGWIIERAIGEVEVMLNHSPPCDDNPNNYMNYLCAEVRHEATKALLRQLTHDLAEVDQESLLPGQPPDLDIKEERAQLGQPISGTLPALTIEADSPQPVQLQLAPIRCWKCNQPMKAARGYIFEPLEVPGRKAFIALKLVSDTRQLAALIADLRKTDASIAPVGFNYSKTVKGQYFSASCPHCSAICGDFHMSGMHFWESVLAPCKFSECECCYTADTECEGCQYHDLNLRLSEDQIFEVSEQVGASRAGHYPEDY